MSGNIEKKLAELGITLPEPANPVANFVAFVNVRGVVYLSGQLPRKDGKIVYGGKLGREVSVADGKAAARLCALNLIAQLKGACNGDLDRVARCVRLSGFVNSAPDFTDLPQVLNGASDLMTEIFGDSGKHARTAVGVATLPSGAAVEVEAIFELKD